MYTTATNTLHVVSDSGGEHTNPPAEEILATTDQLPAGRYLMTVTICTRDLDSSQAQFSVQHRDQYDDECAIVGTITVTVPVDDSRQFDCSFVLEELERVSVVPYISLVGTVSAAINWQRVS